MMAELMVALSALGLVIIQRRRTREKVKRRNRTKSVKSWIQQWQAQGAYPNLCQELVMNEPADFRNFARMFPVQFQMLEESIRPIIQHRNTNNRDSVSARERLMVTLCFLTTGESFRSLSYQFRLGVSTIRQFVLEICEAIYLSIYHNYKHHFSIVLMAMVDSYYRFLYVDVGCQGRIFVGGVFAECTSADALENRITNIPAPAPLPGSDQLSPYCTVADEAFPLKEYLMKPYPHRGLSLAQHVFNYRLSRAWRVVENAFGTLASRFRVLLTTINTQDTAKVEKIVLACCALHNFLRTESCEAYLVDISDREGPDNAISPGRWREDPALQQASLPRATNVATSAKQTRDNLCQYFMSDCGAVPLQWGKV